MSRNSLSRGGIVFLTQDVVGQALARFDVAAADLAVVAELAVLVAVR